MIKESRIGSPIQFPAKAIAFPDALTTNTQGEEGERVKRENAYNMYVGAGLGTKSGNPPQTEQQNPP